MWYVKDSYGKIVKKFRFYHIARDYKDVFGNYGWLITDKI